MSFGLLVLVLIQNDLLGIVTCIQSSRFGMEQRGNRHFELTLHVKWCFVCREKLGWAEALAVICPIGCPGPAQLYLTVVCLTSS